MTQQRESIRKCIKSVREAYAYTDDEVEFLWRRLQIGDTCEQVQYGAVAEEGERGPHWATVARLLAKKLAIDEREGDIHKFQIRKRFVWFAHWLFNGEDRELIANKPDILQCPEYPLGCGLQYERSAFPYWPTDNRCNACIRKSCHPQKGLNSRRLAVQNLHKLVGLETSQQLDRDLDRFARAFSRMVRLEGGIDGIAEHWHNWFEAMREDEKGRKSPTLGKAYMAMMKVWLELDKHRDQQANFADMKDEELRQFIVQQMVSRMTREQVEQFIDATAADMPLLERASEGEVSAEAAYIQQL